MLPLGNNFFSLRAAPFKKFFSDSTTPLMFYKYRLCMYKHIMYERPFIVYLKLYFAVSHSQVGDFFYYIANCTQIKIADIYMYTLNRSSK